MKKVFTLIIAVSITFAGFSQSCLLEGITFHNQADIDNFQTNFPNCTQIDGNVNIWGNSLTNLNGLSVLTSIGGYVFIHNTYSLYNLSGLDNLTSVGGYFRIKSNPNLTSLSGLENLTSIGGMLDIFNNNSLTSLSGLENLTDVGGALSISINGVLTNLIGLDNLSSIGGNLSISSNELMTSLNGLENLTSIGGNLEIYYNLALTSISALNNIDTESIGDLTITNNDYLSTCNEQIICEYLASPNGSVNIYENATGCNSPIEVASSCGITLQCFPFGNYYFLSQTDIDNFQSTFPDCTELEGNVTISGGDITNLTGINIITAINGDVDITGNSNLKNLSGLDNLNFIGGHLAIYWNGALTSLAGLENLDSTADFIRIQANPHLNNLAGLEGLISIGGFFEIRGNDTLANLTGLDNLTSIAESLVIASTTALTNLNGLYNLTSVGGNLEIFWNEALNSLMGLEGLTTVSYGLFIKSNNTLTSLIGLDNLTSIGSYLSVESNNGLTSLSGLENLTSIGDYLKIYDNGVLTSLSGIDNIDSGSITDLHIYSNALLSTCEVQSVCDYLASPNDSVEIHDNASGCNSQGEVEAACSVGIDDKDTPDSQITISPNPSTTSITISTPTTPEKNAFLTIYNINGQTLKSHQITDDITVVDVSGLSQGVYFVKVSNDRTVAVGRFVKQ
jgi:hypothetical protein